MTRENSVTKVGERIAKPDVNEIDRTLRRLAQAQAALDADEAHWLRIAEQQNVWPQLGYVHALEYLEDVFGYAPRTALERVRVARELGELPQLEDALRVGELSYSAVRELSRVASPETIDAWLDAARGLRFRDVEKMVAGRRKGDGPDAKPDPALVKHRLVLELDGESLAIWRQVRQVVELELEQSLDDRALVLALGERLICASDGSPSDTSEVDATSPGVIVSKSLLARHQYMIHLITCRGCGGAWQDGGGVRFPVDKSVLERAQCDALVCDDETGERAKRTIPTAIVRQVLERAQHRCQVPGCRSSKHLRIHHIEFWSAGGGHDLSNLIVLCDGHHRTLHDGHLRVAGRAPDELVFTRNGIRIPSVDQLRELTPATETHAVRRHARPAKIKTTPQRPPFEADNATQARAALVQLGFSRSIAARAVEQALARVRADTSLGDLIRAALQQTPRT